MSYIDQRAKRTANRLVKKDIISYVFESINDNSSNHDQLKKSCLTDSKISDIERLFNMKENYYRILITSMFGNDKFINEILVAQEYYHLLTTQDVYLQRNKFSLLPLHLIMNNPLHPILKKIENCQKVARV